MDETHSIVVGKGLWESGTEEQGMTNAERSFAQGHALGMSLTNEVVRCFEKRIRQTNVHP